MKHVWVIRAGAEGEVHDLFLRKGLVGMAWAAVGDLSRFECIADLRRRFVERYPNINAAASIGYSGQLFRFCQEVTIDDFVIYPVKGKEEIHTGCVAGTYSFDPDLHGGEWAHWRQVEWGWCGKRQALRKDLIHRIGAPLALCQVRLQEQDLKFLGFE